jgi:hypothetical protein
MQVPSPYQSWTLTPGLACVAQLQVPATTVLIIVVRTSAVRKGCLSGQIYVLVSVRKPMSDELDLSALVS